MRLPCIWLILCGWPLVPCQGHGQNTPQTDSLRLLQAPARVGLVQISVSGARRTRTAFITREMNVTPGDSLSTQDLGAILMRNQQLVYNTGLFNKVTVGFSLTNDSLTLEVTVTERWYIFPEVRLQPRDITLQAFLRNPSIERLTYRAGISWRNITGRNDRLNLRVVGGFDRGFSLSYSRPLLAADARLWGGGFALSYTANPEVIVTTTQGDFERISLSPRNAQEVWNGVVQVTKRFNQNRGIDLSLGYRHYLISDSVARSNPDYLTLGKQQLEFTTVRANLWWDTRDIRAFPLHGYSARVSLEAHGLDRLSATTWARLDAQVFRYFRLERSPLYVALGADLVYFMGSEIPFPEKGFLGQANIRGFDDFVIDGSLFGSIRSELKLELIRRRIVTIKQLPRQFRDFPLGFYPFIFSDTGYANDFTNSNNDRRFKNRLLAGWGVGLDVPFVYDNLLRIELATNNFGFSSVLLNFSVALR